MARKPTDKQLFKMKNEWLGQFYEEVKPKDFYRAVFPEGSFEREGHPEDEKCNGVLTVIEGEKARNYIVFDELNMVDEVKGAEFAIMSPVGYSGRNRTASSTQSKKPKLRYRALKGNMKPRAESLTAESEKLPSSRQALNPKGRA